MTALQKMAAFARNIQHSGERMQESRDFFSENPWKSWGCLLDGFNHFFKVGKQNVWENNGKHIWFTHVYSVVGHRLLHGRGRKCSVLLFERN
jgi:hypothetical protein